MKKFLIIGAVVFLAGALLFTGAMAAADWDFSALSTVPKYEVKTFTADNNGLDITIDNSNTPVRLGTSEDGKVHLEYYDNTKQYYVINESDKLTVERVDTYKWYERFFQFDLQKPKLTLLLPENYAGNIYIINDNGNFTIDGLSTSGTLYHRTSNGSITLKNFRSASVEVKTSNGNITVSDCQIETTLKATTSNGNYVISDSSVGNMITLKTSNGDATVTNLTAAELFDIKTSNGSIRLTELACNDITVKTSNGNITLGGVDGDSVYLKTSNGNIRGSIEGSMSDYNIISHTSNGNNNLPTDTSGNPRKLEVRTSNGDIKISFSK